MEEEAGPSKTPLIDSPASEEFKFGNVNNIREVSPSSSTASGVSFHEIEKPWIPQFQLREPVFVGLTKRQLLILIVFSLSEFFGAIVYSIHGPFFPKEASRKGVSASQFGFTFGVFELIVLIFLPIFGRMDSINPNILYHLGIFTAGIGAVIFSLLGFVSGPTLFLILSIVIRIIEGVGEAAIISASFTLIADEFPEAVTSTFASLKTFFGLGIICGPVMGGALYDGLYSDDGRFTLTFGVLGGILLLIGIVGLFILPKSDTHSHELEGRKSIRGIQIISILRIGSVRLAAFSIMSAAISIGFLSAIMELHLRPFSIHPVLLGGIFIINGGLYAISAPIWGWIIEKILNPKYFILFGASLILEGFLLIGPAPFIPLDTSIFLTCIGLSLQGLGLGAVLVASFNLTLRKAVEFGHRDNIETYGIVSSLWIAMFSFGCFVGPPVAGILFDNYGFKSSTWLVIGLQILLIFTTILSIFTNTTTTREENFKDKHFENENKPLLYSNNSKSHISSAAANGINIKYGATQA